MSNLDIAIRKQVPTVPQALKALAAMERELTAAKTYEDLRRVIKEASALKVLMNDVAEVKAAAENAILFGNKRIAEELRKVPKAGGPGRGKRLPPQGKSLSGKAATGIKHSTRSRLGKLADKSDAEIRATADRLREQGKDATPTAVVRELTHGNKAERRAQRERDLSAKILALPEKKYGVVLEDYEWDHETWSERGKDRHASNHYSTSADAHTAEEIVARTKERFDCAADDCVLFMWVTSPFLDVAMDVLRLRGFTYKTTIMWDKVVDGTGYWFRNRHEQMLIGTRGNVPAPAPGTQWSSVIVERKRGHSVKPEQSYQMIEQYFPNVPKIELNCRGKPRPGWDAWGNEVEEAAE